MKANTEHYKRRHPVIAAANITSHQKNGEQGHFNFTDYQFHQPAQMKLHEMITNSPKLSETIKPGIITNLQNPSNLIQPSTPIQRRKGSPNRITEGEWAFTGKGGNLLFTALAAGCLAITVLFPGGGGAGLHMALNLPNAAQWNEFRDAIAGKSIDTVILDSDMIGQDQGWHIKLNKITYANETEMSPRSAGELIAEYGQGFGSEGWICSTAMTKGWFKKVLGANNVIYNKTNDIVVHSC